MGTAFILQKHLYSAFLQLLHCSVVTPVLGVTTDRGLVTTKCVNFICASCVDAAGFTQQFESATDPSRSLENLQSKSNASKSCLHVPAFPLFSIQLSPRWAAEQEPGPTWFSAPVTMASIHPASIFPLDSVSGNGLACSQFISSCNSRQACPVAEGRKEEMRWQPATGSLSAFRTDGRRCQSDYLIFLIIEMIVKR